MEHFVATRRRTTQWYVIAAPLLLCLMRSACDAQNVGFVQVQGNHFVLNGQPYYYTGANCYYLMVYAANVSLRPQVSEVLQDAAAMGLTVVRTWAFSDGADQWNALQTSPGVYQEYVFRGLDYVLYRADQLGIRVILPLVSNWDDYGGMNQYVEWSAGATAHDDFYTDADCKQWYKDHVAQVLNRRNIYNGRTYRNDPTVFAWELANEPRQESNAQGDELQAWIEEMSAAVKAIDPTHLVTTGSEGFYGPTGPNHNPEGWMSSRGVDYIRNHTPAGIDFCAFHAWPDGWGLSYDAAMTWARDHINDTDALLGKPVILEEFGKIRPLGTRDQFYQGWYNELYDAAAQRKSAGGSNFWILYHDAYPDFDGFGVYRPADASTCGIISTEAARMRNLIAAHACDAVDFNKDGVFPDTTDIFDLLTVFAGGQCPTDPPVGAGCQDLDFNNDGIFPDNTDIETFLRVFSGGSC